MPLPRPVHPDRGRLSVALDATPLLGRPTGVGAFVTGLLSGLRDRQDVDVAAFAVSWRLRHVVAERVPAGVSTRQRAIPARPVRQAWRRWSWPPVEWFVGHHDIVHGTNYIVPPTSEAAQVVSVHDLTPLRYPDLCDRSTLVFPEMVRQAVARGAFVHTLSAYVAAEVVDAFGVSPERVRTVHLGIPALGSPGGGADSGPGEEVAGDPLVLPPGVERTIVAVGTIEPRKDYPSLVSAFTLLATDRPELALVIVGGDGWGADQLTRVLAASPVRDRIIRPGYVDDARLARIMGRAAVLAYPSVYEGFGFPPLQAMQLGVPVVTTAAGAIPEVVGDGAVVVPPGDPDSLADALGRVLDGGPEVDSLVERGRRRSAHFSWDACAAGLTGLYRDAVADRRKR